MSNLESIFPKSLSFSRGVRHHDFHPWLLALEAGKLCVHPTDTLPGLAFNPWDQVAQSKLLQLKNRQGDKPFLALVSDICKAQSFWQPLPELWRRVLSSLWPSPLSIVWYASEISPPSLVNDRGKIGLRVPNLGAYRAAHLEWFWNALRSIDYPLPTTSINSSGDPPLFDWQSVAKFVGDHPEVFLDEELTLLAKSNDMVTASSGSTVIEVFPNGTFEVLRQGDFPSNYINGVVAAAQ